MAKSCSGLQEDAWHSCVLLGAEQSLELEGRVWLGPVEPDAKGWRILGELYALLHLRR